MAELQRKARWVPAFRRAAMGEQPDLEAIFGAAPYQGAIRHGDTLDAE